MALAIERPLAQPMTAEARASLLAAERQAARSGAQRIEPVHLALGLLDPPSIPLRLLLAGLRVDAAALADRLRPMTLAGTASQPPLAPDDAVSIALERAAQEATTLDAPEIDSRHLLLGLLDGPESAASRLLRESGLSARAVRKQLVSPGSPTGSVARDLVRVVRPSALFLTLLGIVIGSGLLLLMAEGERSLRGLTAVFILSGWIASLCIHEFGHALAGYLGGDRSVVNRGLLTLDPRRYTNPVLSILLPLVFMIAGGFPLPGGAVWIDNRQLRSPRWHQIVSAAGPLGTLLCLVLVSIPFALGLDLVLLPDEYAFWSALAGLGQVLVLALIFNLLPIPPLDGFQLIDRWLPPAVRSQAYALSWLPLMLLYFALSRSGPLSQAFWELSYRVIELCRIPPWLAYDALSQLILR